MKKKSVSQEGFRKTRIRRGVEIYCFLVVAVQCPNRGREVSDMLDTVISG